MSETLDEVRARIRELVSGPGKTSRWIMKHLDYADDDWCLIYPFAWEEGAYPKYKRRVGEKQHVLHRVMCEYRNGVAPTPKHHSAHSCDRGVEGCVNPMHVSWKTPTENQLDRKNTGVGSSRKLTPEIVDQILARKGLDRPIDLAKRFNVSLRNVRFIHAGKAWQSEKFRGRRIFTAEEVHAIRRQKGLVWASKLATQFNCNRSQIDRILGRQSYAWVPEEQISPPVNTHS
jgi:hypothetical protein